MFGIRLRSPQRSLLSGLLLAFLFDLMPLNQPVLAVEIVLDYTYDSGNFFGAGNPDGELAGEQARESLESAASLFSDILTDTFSSIETPASFSSAVFSGVASWSWNLNFNNPASGSTISITDPTIAVNEYRIYAGARSLGGTTLGVGGPGGFAWSQGGNGGFFTQSEVDQIDLITEGFASQVEDREESSGFANWGGAVSFDNDSSTDWHYDRDSLPGNGESDFYSVAVHEIAHALGWGASENWNNWVNGTLYTGPESVSQFGGDVPLDCNISGCAHWAEDTQSTIYGTSVEQETVLDPNLTSGTRKYLTTLDATALDDIGWSLVAPSFSSSDYNYDNDVDGGDLATVQQWYGINGNADSDNDGDTDGTDFLNWQRQRTGTLNTLVANIPEPTTTGLAMLGIMLATSCHRKAR